MSVKYEYFTGPCKWAKLSTPDEFRGEKKWKLNLYLDKTTKSQLKKSGLQLKIREDEDGEYITLTRPVQKEFDDGVKDFEPPKILDKEHNPLDVLLGNGSKVTAKVLVYDSAMGKGHRLEAVRVDDLVEYTAPEGEF